MTAVLTSAGATHLTELNAGSALTDSFDGLIFGTGNDTPGGSDTQLEINPVIETVFQQVDSGWPKKTDTSDSRNPGAITDWWTWRFTIPEGTPFVASNVAVTNYAGGVFNNATDLMIHSDQVIAQRYDERLVVFVNAKASETPTVYTATESALSNRVQRAVGFVATNRALASSPAGSVVDHTEVRTRPQAGQKVWTAASVQGIGGTTLTVGNVRRFTVEVQKWSASDQDWSPLYVEDVNPSTYVLGADRYGDPRWTAQGGYNVSHEWAQPAGTREGTFRLRYLMELDDDDVREWRTIAEVRDGRR